MHSSPAEPMILKSRRKQGHFRSLVGAFLAFIWILFSQQAMAATSSQATPADATNGVVAGDVWWLDLSGYDDALATSPAGQPFEYVLADGSKLKFTLKHTGGAGSVSAVPTMYWSFSIFGSAGFYAGIGGNPQLRSASGPASFQLENIVFTDNAGTAGAPFRFVAADAEGTGGSEQISFTTNGGAWTELDKKLPTIPPNSTQATGLGTSSVNFAAVAPSANGSGGVYVVSTQTPTVITADLVAGRNGAQGVIFGFIPTARAAAVPTNSGFALLLLAGLLGGAVAFTRRKRTL